MEKENPEVSRERSAVRKALLNEMMPIIEKIEVDVSNIKKIVEKLVVVTSKQN